MATPDRSIIDRLLDATTVEELHQIHAEVADHRSPLIAEAVTDILEAIRVLPPSELAEIEAAVAARRGEGAATAQRAAAYRRGGMEVAREHAGDTPLPACTVIVYGLEAEARATGQPVDELAVGDPAATEALEEVVRLKLRTHVMRGWLHRNWQLVSERAETILRVNEIGAGW